MYTAEIARALKARGHEVEIFCPLPGKIANLITPSGISVCDRLSDLPFVPEVIHGHHHLPLMAALARFEHTPAIHLWHGTRPWVERVPDHPRIKRYVVTSDRMAPRLRAEFGIAEDRVRSLPNFVDTERYSHVREVAKTPGRAVLFGQSGFYPHELEMLEQACADNGLALDKVGYAYGNPRPRPEYFLPDYDIAFAVGRSALEAMASGCAVIPIVPQLAGARITEDSLETWAASNYSPRYFTGADRFDSAWMAQQLQSWDPEDIAAVTQQVRQDFTLERAIDRLERLYEEAVQAPYDAGSQAAFASYLEWMAREADGLWAQTATAQNELDKLRAENARLKAQDVPPGPLPDAIEPVAKAQLSQSARSDAARRARIEASGLFDPGWYRRTYEDVAASGVDPLVHYMQIGWSEGRSPSAYFDGRAYLDTHPDLEAEQITPLEHYLSRIDALTNSLRAPGAQSTEA